MSQRLGDELLHFLHEAAFEHELVEAAAVVKTVLARCATVESEVVAEVPLPTSTPAALDPPLWIVPNKALSLSKVTGHRGSGQQISQLFRP